MDIIVTTPKKESANAVLEAADALAGKVHYYFREFAKKPKDLNLGDKIFYVDKDLITGYAIAERISVDPVTVWCETSNRAYSKYQVYMRCDSWHWITPIPMKGFRSFRYIKNINEMNIKVVGTWKDPKPVQ